MPLLKKRASRHHTVGMKLLKQALHHFKVERNIRKKIVRKKLAKMGGGG
jgi:hypothetical protein